MTLKNTAEEISFQAVVAFLLSAEHNTPVPPIDLPLKGRNREGFRRYGHPTTNTDETRESWIRSPSI
jgi:hypothetical protein